MAPSLNSFRWPFGKWTCPCFIPLLWLQVCAYDAYGQEERRLYDVISAGDTVGYVQATRRIVGSEIQYFVVSDVTISMLFKVRVKYTVKAIFQDDQLRFSDATVFVNDKEKHRVEARYVAGKYAVIKDGDETSLHGPIQASSASLYFQRPDGLDHVFSETSGTLKTLQKRTDQTFLSIEPNERSNLNTYSYKHAHALQSILVERFLMPTLFIERSGK